MGIVAAPSTCAECHTTEILNLRCRNCRLFFCDGCAEQLRSRCPVCKRGLEKRGFELF
ncbi:MAG: hypothetical protein ABSF83_06715 [Nitrososphaerales archaeon]